MTTTELDDGTVVFVESEAAKEAEEMRETVAAGVSAQAPPPPPQDGGDEDSPPETAPAAPADGDGAGDGDGGGGVSSEQLALVERLRAQVAAKSWGVAHPDPQSKSRIPVTRAERRRLIKEEIRRLAQADQPVYYQRRLW